MNNRRKAIIHTGLRNHRLISMPNGLWAVQRHIGLSWEDCYRPTTLDEAKQQLVNIAAAVGAKGELV